ncbi:MAG: purine-nucleoside phosphorylase [Myxococcales bacterium]|nr:purine-nucleoside phosphorylase [Myxococcales bacterium]
MITDPYAAAKEAADHLRARCAAPRVAVVLGSGLGAFADALEEAHVFDYGELPHFPSVAVKGHAGKLVVGRIGAGGPRVAAFSGRVHLYEGHGTPIVVHPTRTLRQWGGLAVVYTNAAGGIDPTFVPGDLMLISDHLNLTGRNPLVGPNDDRMGERFPDMSTAYDPELRAELRAAAAATGVKLHQGVYAGLLGPSYETPAEIRMLRTMGGNAVGMSTVAEVIAARHVGLRVAGISCITNLAAGLSKEALSHDDIKHVADRVRTAFIALLGEGLKRIDARLAGQEGA